MCLPGCLEHVHARLSRRSLLGAGAAVAAGAALPVRPAAAAESRSFTQVVDLTHTISPEFPTFFGKPGIAFEDLYSYAKESST